MTAVSCVLAFRTFWEWSERDEYMVYTRLSRSHVNLCMCRCQPYLIFRLDEKSTYSFIWMVFCFRLWFVWIEFCEFKFKFEFCIVSRVVFYLHSKNRWNNFHVVCSVVSRTFWNVSFFKFDPNWVYLFISCTHLFENGYNSKEENMKHKTRL